MKILLLFPFVFFQATGNFDCQSRDSSSSCSTELRCIYDEAYEEKTTFCACKVVINTVSLPDNTLKSSLLKTLCSTQRHKVEQLEVTDAELRNIDNRIFDTYPNLKVLDLSGNRIRVNFSEKSTDLVELNLKSNHLTTLGSLSGLKFLRILTLSSNKLEEVDTIERLPDLEELYLNNNRLVVLGNDFTTLPKLRILNLSGNFLVSWRGLVSDSLQELYLDHNKLTSLNRDDFEKLPKLQILDLGHNLISLISAGNLLSKTPDNHNFGLSLQKSYADLSQGISTWSQRNFLQNPNANTANPFQNQNNPGANFMIPGQNQNAQFDGYRTFGPGLQNQQQNGAQFYRPKRQGGFFLHVGGNPYQGNAPTLQENVKNGTISWTKLRELNLSQNRIRQFPEGFFVDLNELRSLNVSHNKLEVFDLKMLNDSPKLTLLDLGRNHLSLDLKLLRDKWPVLKVIDFDVDSEKCGEIREFLKYFKENGVILKSCTAEGCCGE